MKLKNYDGKTSISFEELMESMHKRTLATPPLKREIKNNKYRVRDAKHEYDHARVLYSRLMKLSKQKEKIIKVEEYTDFEWQRKDSPEGIHSLDIHFELPKTLFFRYVLFKKIIEYCCEIFSDISEKDYEDIKTIIDDIWETFKRICSLKPEFSFVLFCCSTESLEPDEKYDYDLHLNYGAPDEGHPNEYSLYYDRCFKEEDIVICTKEWIDKRVPELKDFKIVVVEEK